MRENLLRENRLKIHLRYHSFKDCNTKKDKMKGIPMQRFDIAKCLEDNPVNNGASGHGLDTPQIIPNYDHFLTVNLSFGVHLWKALHLRRREDLE